MIVSLHSKLFRLGYISLLLAPFAGTLCIFAQTAAPKPHAQAAKPDAVYFEDIAARAGLTALDVYGGDKHKEFIIETTGNGAVIFDYENNGWPDIFLPNGSTVEGFSPGQAPTSHLYHNNRDGTFTDVTVKAGLAHAGWGQGACVGDYDNDGYLDLVVTYCCLLYTSTSRRKTLSGRASRARRTKKFTIPC